MAVSIFNRSTEYADQGAPTKVNVEGFAGHALDGIVDAINNTSMAVSRLTDTVDRGNEEEDRRNKHEVVASMASARNNRAAMLALQGKTDKVISATDGLKKAVMDALNSMLGILKENLRLSLRSYDETTRSLRSVFLSTKEIEEETHRADKAAREASALGVSISSRETKSVVAALNNQGIATKGLTEIQIAAVSAAQKTGIDAKEAVERVRLMNDADAKKMINTYAMASQQTGAATFKAFHSWAVQNATTLNNAIKASGLSQADYMNAQLKFAQQIDSVIGNYVTDAGAQTDIMETLLKLESGQLESVEEQKILQLLGIAPEVFKSSGDKQALLLEGMQKVIQGGNQTQLRVLQNSLGGNSPLINGLSNAAEAYANKSYKQKDIKSDEDAKAAYNEKNPGGVFGKIGDKLISGLNLLTGGGISKLSASLNKYFGENVSIETVVSKGFVTVIGLLTAISTSIIFKAPLQKALTAITKSGIFQKVAGSVTGLFKRRSSGGGGGGDLPNNDSKELQALRKRMSVEIELEEIKKEFNQTMSKIKKGAFDIESKISWGMSSLRLASKDGFAAVRRNAKDAFADMKLRIRDSAKAMSIDIGTFARKGLVHLAKGIKSAPGAFLGAGKALAVLGGIATLLATLVAATGALDQLKPIFDAFIKQVTEPFTALVTAIKPVVEDLMKVVGDLTVELVNLLTPIIKGVLDALMPLIKTMIDVLTPVIKNVLAAVAPALQSLMVLMKPLQDTFATLIPPLTNLLMALLEPMLELLPTMVDLFTSLLPVLTERLIPAISGISKVISFVISPIVGAIKTIAEGITGLVNWKFGANGGIYDKPTNMVIGEAGKEVLLPLTKNDRMRELLSQLSPSERAQVAAAAATNKSTNTSNNSSSNAPVDSGLFKSEYEAAVAKINAWGGGRMKPKEFSAMIGPIAREAMISTGLPASVLVAQAALETGWGKTAKAEFRNLFGIKGSGDAGSAVVWTHEIRKDGSKEVKQDAFAQYTSYVESIKAYNKYLMNAKRPKHGLPGDLRYAEAMQHAFEPNLFAYLLRDGGYATSANYGQKLVNVMKANDLYKYNVPPSSVSLSGIGDIQTELINQAKENLKSPLSSEERLKQLQRDEYDRLVKKAIKDGSPMPKPPAGISLGTVSPDTSSPGSRILNEQKNLSAASTNTLDKYSSTAYGAGLVKYMKERVLSPGSSDTKEIISFMEVMTRYLRDLVTSNKRPTGVAARPTPTKF